MTASYVTKTGKTPKHITCVFNEDGDQSFVLPYNPMATRDDLQLAIHQKYMNRFTKLGIDPGDFKLHLIAHEEPLDDVDIFGTVSMPEQSYCTEADDI